MSDSAMNLVKNKKNDGVVIVLGAAGFIGRHVCKKLSSKGLVVLGLGNGDWNASEWSGWGISSWLKSEIELASLDAVSAGFEEPIGVINCAGNSSVYKSYEFPFVDFQRTTSSTNAALEWIRTRTNNKAKFVLVSSAAVYGNVGNQDAFESSQCDAVSPYGVNKQAAEMLCESYSKFFGVSTSVVRLFSVYGIGLKKQLLWDAMNKFKRKEYIFYGTGNEIRDWIHVDDASELLYKAMMQKGIGVDYYNGGAEKKMVKEVLGILLSMYGESIELIFTGEEHKGNPSRLTANCERTKSILDWTPTISLNDGLKNYVEWFKMLTIN